VTLALVLSQEACWLCRYSWSNRLKLVAQFQIN